MDRSERNKKIRIIHSTKIHNADIFDMIFLVLAFLLFLMYIKLTRTFRHFFWLSCMDELTVQTAQS